MTRGSVVVIEDKDTMRGLIEKVLAGAFVVRTAASGEHGLQRVREDPPDVVISDIRLPGIDGLAVLAAVKAAAPDTEVLLVTAFGEVAQAVQALKAGAFHYLTKPFDPDELLVTAERALDHKRLRERARSLTAEVSAAYGLGSLVGTSAAMRRVYSLVERLRDRSVPVLVTGESGTGKELVARALHYTRSSAAGRPFVALNCGAIPATLIESELFGHTRGAFSGAVQAKRGLVEEADGGTLFLDEIGDLPLELQVKLNRVLEGGSTRRLGDVRETHVDVRVVAATHRDLPALVRDGRFREDLYYRLNVVAIAVPPLRERKEDLLALVGRFLARLREREGQAPLRLSPEALAMLQTYSWPGNVRELRNVIERAAILTDGDEIAASALPAALCGASTPAGAIDGAVGTYEAALAQARDDASRQYLQAVLRATGGNVTRAAAQAGLQRESLHRLLRRYDLDPETFRGG